MERRRSLATPRTTAPRISRAVNAAQQRCRTSLATWCAKSKEKDMTSAMSSTSFFSRLRIICLLVAGTPGGPKDGQSKVVRVERWDEQYYRCQLELSSCAHSYAVYNTVSQLFEPACTGDRRERDSQKKKLNPANGGD
eukprot:9465631-Pyramimonas_sp.AAC.1